MTTITAEQIRQQLGVEASMLTPGDVDNLTRCAAAVSTFVARLPIVTTSATPDVWGADVVLGAIVFGARLFSRRNSPTGIAQFQDLGTAYISSYDPDIGRLLGLDKYAPGVVA